MKNYLENDYKYDYFIPINYNTKKTILGKEVQYLFI